jgi:hypothetical protein
MGVVRAARLETSGSPEKIKEKAAVARVIEFYVPANFRKKPAKWIPLEQRGRVLEFISQSKKSA